MAASSDVGSAADTRVSVVIATYRRPDALARAIVSALAQTHAPLEVIVAGEQGDTDTAALVAGHADPRVRLVVNPVRGGPGPARDLGARAARGRFVAFLDDDDLWHPEKLARQVALADDRTIVTALSEVVSPEGRLVKPTRPYDGKQAIDEWLFDRRTWLGGGEAMLQTSSLMVPRALFDTLGFGSAQHEEWEFAIRALRTHGYRLATVPDVLVTYFTGQIYSWEGSIGWARDTRGLLTPRALSGFCLTVASQSIPPRGWARVRAAGRLLGTAVRHGRPTARQLFAFALIAAVPHGVRRRLRSGGGAA
ncbi:glycosyltransferase [uncultured Sphingomonas sp.]